MKVCPICKVEVTETAAFCTKCGTKLQVENQNDTQGAAPSSTQGNTYNNTHYYQMPIDIYDHTADFEEKDIRENKVVAMLVYLLGTLGIIIALLASSTSPYASFHVRQALKFTVLDILLGIIGVMLCWTFIVPVAAMLMFLTLYVVRIISFFSICNGKAKEPVIVRSFRFLR